MTKPKCVHCHDTGVIEYHSRGDTCYERCGCTSHEKHQQILEQNKQRAREIFKKITKEDAEFLNLLSYAIYVSATFAH